MASSAAEAFVKRANNRNNKSGGSFNKEVGSGPRPLTIKQLLDATAALQAQSLKRTGGISGTLDIDGYELSHVILCGRVTRTACQWKNQDVGTYSIEATLFDTTGVVTVRQHADVAATLPFPHDETLNPLPNPWQGRCPQEGTLCMFIGRVTIRIDDATQELYPHLVGVLRPSGVDFFAQTGNGGAIMDSKTTPDDMMPLYHALVCVDTHRYLLAKRRATDNAPSMSVVRTEASRAQQAQPRQPQPVPIGFPQPVRAPCVNPPPVPPPPHVQPPRPQYQPQPAAAAFPVQYVQQPRNQALPMATQQTNSAVLAGKFATSTKNATPKELVLNFLQSIDDGAAEAGVSDGEISVETNLSTEQVRAALSALMDTSDVFTTGEGRFAASTS